MASSSDRIIFASRRGAVVAGVATTPPRHSTTGLRTTAPPNVHTPPCHHQINANELIQTSVHIDFFRLRYNISV